MRSAVDDRFRRELALFNLVYTCERCAHFEPRGEGCAFGYPTSDHREADLQQRSEVCFCKAFELG